MITAPEPDPSNAFLVDHIDLLRRSLRHWTGRDLVAPKTSPEEAAREIFHAPFVVLSHGSGADPVLTYGNRAALGLFELSWAALTRMPSRLTAEAPDREERARLLAKVRARGFVDDYAGVRVSSRGRRFWVHGATVWNLMDAGGQVCGQAATFAVWRHL